jgi:1-phosphofructokinase/tagatose 6-phosphate kinase
MRPTIIKPNLSEFCQTFMPGKSVLENEDNEHLKDVVRPIVQDIYETYGVRTVITRGKFDTWVYDGSSLVVIPNKKGLPVVNTIGCGDALTAGLTHALLKGEVLPQAVAFGMECAMKKATHIRNGLF